MIESTMLSLRPPAKQNFRRLPRPLRHSWCLENAVPAPLVDQVLRCMMAAKTWWPSAGLLMKDRLTIVLRKYFPFWFNSEKYLGDRIARHSEERRRKVVVFIRMIMAAGLLYGAILNFYRLTSAKAKLVLIAAYTIPYALCVGLLTNARKIGDIRCMCRPVLLSLWFL